ncbi:helix-turn-helix domain-containing protein [Streptomyces sp. CWNU-52B]|uniref:helix-turn-helix domain-containing protein n=1 Tax=unclassified Streptomyces TaxID=2593676 RepID=UPI0039C4751C
MSDWQPLPTELPSEVRHFVEQLRVLKDRTGLSLVALAERTAYSKSSWHRYLNATQPPPRQAVIALCRVAGARADAERFAVRWELAVRVWPRTMPAPAATGGAPTGDGVPGGGAAEVASTEGGYEDDPTLPWWDLLGGETSDSGSDSGSEPVAPARDSSHRLLLYALLLVLVLLLVAVAGAVTLS